MDSDKESPAETRSSSSGRTLPRRRRKQQKYDKFQASKQKQAQTQPTDAATTPPPRSASPVVKKRRGVPDSAHKAKLVKRLAARKTYATSISKSFSVESQRTLDTNQSDVERVDSLMTQDSIQETVTDISEPEVAHQQPEVVELKSSSDTRSIHAHPPNPPRQKSSKHDLQREKKVASDISVDVNDHKSGTVTVTSEPEVVQQQPEVVEPKSSWDTRSIHAYPPTPPRKNSSKPDLQREKKVSSDTSVGDKERKIGFSNKKTDEAHSEQGPKPFQQPGMLHTRRSPLDDDPTLREAAVEEVHKSLQGKRQKYIRENDTDDKYASDDDVFHDVEDQLSDTEIFLDVDPDLGDHNDEQLFFHQDDPFFDTVLDLEEQNNVPGSNDSGWKATFDTPPDMVDENNVRLTNDSGWKASFDTAQEKEEVVEQVDMFDTSSSWAEDPGAPTFSPKAMQIFANMDEVQQQEQEQLQSEPPVNLPPYKDDEPLLALNKSRSETESEPLVGMSSNEVTEGKERIKQRVEAYTAMPSNLSSDADDDNEEPDDSGDEAIKQQAEAYAAMSSSHSVESNDRGIFVEDDSSYSSSSSEEGKWGMNYVEDEDSYSEAFESDNDDCAIVDACSDTAASLLEIDKVLQTSTFKSAVMAAQRASLEKDIPTDAQKSEDVLGPTVVVAMVESPTKHAADVVTCSPEKIPPAKDWIEVQISEESQLPAKETIPFETDVVPNTSDSVDVEAGIDTETDEVVNVDIAASKSQSRVEDISEAKPRDEEDIDPVPDELSALQDDTPDKTKADNTAKATVVEPEDVEDEKNTNTSPDDPLVVPIPGNGETTDHRNVSSVTKVPQTEEDVVDGREENEGSATADPAIMTLEEESKATLPDKSESEKLEDASTRSETLEADAGFVDVGEDNESSKCAGRDKTTGGEEFKASSEPKQDDSVAHSEAALPLASAPDAVQAAEKRGNSSFEGLVTLARPNESKAPLESELKTEENSDRDGTHSESGNPLAASDTVNAEEKSVYSRAVDPATATFADELKAPIPAKSETEEKRENASAHAEGGKSMPAPDIVDAKEENANSKPAGRDMRARAEESKPAPMDLAAAEPNPNHDETPDIRRVSSDTEVPRTEADVADGGEKSEILTTVDLAIITLEEEMKGTLRDTSESEKLEDASTRSETVEADAGFVDVGEDNESSKCAGRDKTTGGEEFKASSEPKQDDSVAHSEAALPLASAPDAAQAAEKRGNSSFEDLVSLARPNESKAPLESELKTEENSDRDGTHSESRNPLAASDAVNAEEKSVYSRAVDPAAAAFVDESKAPIPANSETEEKRVNASAHAEGGKSVPAPDIVDAKGENANSKPAGRDMRARAEESKPAPMDLSAAEPNPNHDETPDIRRVSSDTEVPRTESDVAHGAEKSESLTTVDLAMITLEKEMKGTLPDTSESEKKLEDASTRSEPAKQESDADVVDAGEDNESLKCAGWDIITGGEELKDWSVAKLESEPKHDISIAHSETAGPLATTPDVVQTTEKRGNSSFEGLATLARANESKAQPKLELETDENPDNDGTHSETGKPLAVSDTADEEEESACSKSVGPATATFADESKAPIPAKSETEEKWVTSSAYADASDTVGAEEESAYSKTIGAAAAAATVADESKAPMPANSETEEKWDNSSAQAETGKSVPAPDIVDAEEENAKSIPAGRDMRARAEESKHAPMDLAAAAPIPNNDETPDYRSAFPETEVPRTEADVLDGGDKGGSLASAYTPKATVEDESMATLPKTSESSEKKLEDTTTHSEPAKPESGTDFVDVGKDNESSKSAGRDISKRGEEFKVSPLAKPESAKKQDDSIALCETAVLMATASDVSNSAEERGNSSPEIPEVITRYDEQKAPLDAKLESEDNPDDACAHSETAKPLAPHNVVDAGERNISLVSIDQAKFTVGDESKAIIRHEASQEKPVSANSHSRAVPDTGVPPDNGDDPSECEADIASTIFDDESKLSSPSKTKTAPDVTPDDTGAHSETAKPFSSPDVADASEEGKESSSGSSDAIDESKALTLAKSASESKEDDAISHSETTMPLVEMDAVGTGANIVLDQTAFNFSNRANAACHETSAAVEKPDADGAHSDTTTSLFGPGVIGLRTRDNSISVNVEKVPSDEKRNEQTEAPLSKAEVVDSHTLVHGGVASPSPAAFTIEVDSLPSSEVMATSEEIGRSDALARKEILATGEESAHLVYKPSEVTRTKDEALPSSGTPIGGSAHFENALLLPETSVASEAVIMPLVDNNAETPEEESNASACRIQNTEVPFSVSDTPEEHVTPPLVDSASISEDDNVPQDAMEDGSFASATRERSLDKTFSNSLEDKVSASCVVPTSVVLSNIEEASPDKSALDKREKAVSGAWSEAIETGVQEAETGSVGTASVEVDDTAFPFLESASANPITVDESSVYSETDTSLRESQDAEAMERRTRATSFDSASITFEEAQTAEPPPPPTGHPKPKKKRRKKKKTAGHMESEALSNEWERDEPAATSYESFSFTLREFQSSIDATNPPPPPFGDPKKKKTKRRRKKGNNDVVRSVTTPETSDVDSIRSESKITLADAEVAGASGQTMYTVSKEGAHDESRRSTEMSELPPPPPGNPKSKKKKNRRTNRDKSRSSVHSTTDKAKSDETSEYETEHSVIELEASDAEQAEAKSSSANALIASNPPPPPAGNPRRKKKKRNNKEEAEAGIKPSSKEVESLVDNSVNEPENVANEERELLPMPIEYSVHEHAESYPVNISPLPPPPPPKDLKLKKKKKKDGDVIIEATTVGASGAEICNHEDNVPADASESRSVGGIEILTSAKDTMLAPPPPPKREKTKQERRKSTNRSIPLIPPPSKEKLKKWGKEGSFQTHQQPKNLIAEEKSHESHDTSAATVDVHSPALSSSAVGGSSSKMAEKLALASSIAARTFEEQYAVAKASAGYDESRPRSDQNDLQSTEEPLQQPDTGFFCSPDSLADNCLGTTNSVGAHGTNTRASKVVGPGKVDQHNGVAPDTANLDEAHDTGIDLMGGAFSSWTASNFAYGSDSGSVSDKVEQLALPSSDSINEPRDLKRDAVVASEDEQLLRWLVEEVLLVPHESYGSKTHQKPSVAMRTLLQDNDNLNRACQYASDYVNEHIGSNPSSPPILSALSSDSGLSIFKTYTDESGQILIPFQLTPDTNVSRPTVLAANFVSFLQRLSQWTLVPLPFGDDNPFMSEIVASSMNQTIERPGDAVPIEADEKSMQDIVFGHPKGDVVGIVKFLFDACRICTRTTELLHGLMSPSSIPGRSEFSTHQYVDSVKPHDPSSPDQTPLKRNLIQPDDGPNPFETTVHDNPSLLLAFLNFLGDPQALCRMMMVNRYCRRILKENAHVAFRDAVRLGGLSMNLRPAFWLWVILDLHGNDDSSDTIGANERESFGQSDTVDVLALERIGREGKWHNVIQRDVARSFGNMPPHKTGARLRTDSIVRALVTWGKSRVMKRGVKGGGDESPIPEVSSDGNPPRKKSKPRPSTGPPPWDTGDDASHASDVSRTPTDTVSDWGGISPVGSCISACTPAGSEGGRAAERAKSPSNISDTSAISEATAEELALSGNALTADMKVELQNKLGFILYALAAAHEDVGYCQGMDYVVAHLLRVLQETVLLQSFRGTLPAVIMRTHSAEHNLIVEETVFLVMDRFLTTYNLRHMYWPELRCLKTCCRVFEKLIQMKLPVLADHFEHHELNIGLFALGWFQTLFLYLPSMPSATVCHMWDIWLVERSFKIFFRVGTAILFLSQPILLNHELEGMMTYLNTFPDATLLNPDILIACALQIKVTNKMLLEFEMEVTRGVQPS